MTTRGFVVTGIIAAMFVVEPVTSGADGFTAVPEPEPESDCPPALRGSSLAATPIKLGVELMFTSATSAQVAGLRAHLRQVATMVDEQARMAREASHDDAEAIPALDIVVKNAPFGARVIVKTKRQLDAMALQNLGQELEDAWIESSCGLGATMRMPTSGRELEPPTINASR